MGTRKYAIHNEILLKNYQLLYLYKTLPHGNLQVGARQTRMYLYLQMKVGNIKRQKKYTVREN